MQTIDLMEALKESLAKPACCERPECAEVRAELVRWVRAAEDAANTIVRLSEELRVAKGQVLVRDAYLNGNEYLSTRVAEARAAIRKEPLL